MVARPHPLVDGCDLLQLSLAVVVRKQADYTHGQSMSEMAILRQQFSYFPAKCVAV
jgi:hypothetical protein